MSDKGASCMLVETTTMSKVHCSGLANEGFVNALKKICVCLLLWNMCTGPCVVAGAADFGSSPANSTTTSSSTEAHEIEIVEWVATVKSSDKMEDAEMKDDIIISANMNFEEAILSFEDNSKFSIVSENNKNAGLQNEAGVNAIAVDNPGSPSKIFNPSTKHALVQRTHVTPLLTEVRRRMKGAGHHISERALFVPTSWGCEPHPAGPPDLIIASKYIQEEMIPALQAAKSFYTIEGTGGFANFIDIVRGVNNPWCIVRSKSFVKWGRRLVATMETVDDAFNKGKQVPVVRNYVKKARFLEIFAEKIINAEKFLTKKCKTFDSAIRTVIEGVLDVLSDLSTVLSIITFLVLPFLDATICGLNNLLAAIVVAIQGALASVWSGRNRKLQDSAYLFDSNTDVRTAFLRVLEHIDDPHIKPVILKILDLNADRIEGKSILDFFMESMGEEDPSFVQDERRINMMIANFTEIGNRYLSYKENSVDLTSLKSAVGAINDVTQAFGTIDQKLEDIFSSVVVPAQQFVNAIVEPFENISKILEPFQPVIDVISEVIDAISWLECPDELGFICDLDEIIVGIVEDLLSAIGLDVNELIDSIGDELSDLFNLPSIDDIDINLPDIDLGISDLVDHFEEKIADVLGKFIFNPVALAFDTSGETDLIKDGVNLEFRYSSSITGSAQVACPPGKFPYVLSAFRRTARCSKDDFTGASTMPCGTSNGPCDVKGGLASCDIPPNPSFFDIPGISSNIFDMVNVLYTCVTQSDIENLDPLPSLSQADGNTIKCSPNQLIVIDDATGLEPCSVGAFRSANSDFCVTNDVLEGPPAQPLNVHANLYGFFTQAKVRFRDGLWNFYNINNRQERLNREYNGNLQMACCGRSFCTNPDCDWAIPLYGIWLSERLDPYTTGITGPLLVYESARNEVYLPQKNSIENQLSNCVVAVKSTCDDQMLEACNFSSAGGCSVPDFLLITHSCLVEGRDTSIPKTNVYTGVAFKEATGAYASVQLNCPMEGGYIEVLEVESGEGLGASAITYDDCNGQAGPCSLGMNKLNRDDPTLRVRYECRCDVTYNPFPNLDTGLCTKCIAGTFRGTRDMEECELCSPGRFSLQGAHQCDECPEGSYSMNEGSTFCIECEQGTYNYVKGQSSKSACVPCELHTFNDQAGSSSCNPCPPGKFAPEERSTSCIDVPFGFYAETRQINVIAPLGALPCNPGNFSSIQGATSCESCPPGTFTNRQGSRTCEPCPLNSYSDTSGNERCTLCLQGTSTYGLGRNSSDSCKTIPSPINYLNPDYMGYTCREMLLLGISEQDETIVNEIANRRENQVGNGICNRGPWNTKQCSWDGGDCCPHTCTIPKDSDESISSALQLRCYHGAMECRDPSVAGTPFGACEDNISDGSSQISVTRVNFSDFDRRLSETLLAVRGDGYCDDILNIAQEQFDGGDCCWETCSSDDVTFPSSCKSNWTSTCKNPSAVFEDEEPPKLVYSFTPTNQTVAVDKIPVPPAVSAKDNDPCFDGVVNYTELRSNGSCPNKFSLKRIWVSEDVSDNFAIESVTINIGDDTPPIATANTYCVEITKNLSTKSNKGKKKNMMKKWVRLHLPVAAQDVCGFINPKYCDPTVRLNFLSCTSSHGVTSEDNNGTSDCFFLNNTQELFMYVDTASTKRSTKAAKSVKSHREYAVQVEYIDVCNNSVDTTLTYIIPNQYHTLTSPSCTDGTIEFSFDESFDLCMATTGNFKKSKSGKSKKSKAGKSKKSKSGKSCKSCVDSTNGNFIQCFNIN